MKTSNGLNPEAQRKHGPGMLLVLLGIVIAAFLLFTVMRGNGGHPGQQPTAHPLPQGAPTK